MFFTSYKKYGRELNSHDLLKFTAITLMIIGHVGAFFFPEMLELRLMGRASLPFFLFLVGYSLNYKFRIDVLVLAVGISIVSVFSNYPIFPLNILYTVVFVRLILLWLEQKKVLAPGKVLYIFAALAIWYFPTFWFFDYGSIALMFAICGYLVRKHSKQRVTVTFIALTLIFYFLKQGYASFDFSAAQIIILFFMVVALGCVMYNYKMQARVFVANNIVISVVLFISRNSLQIYFLHLVIFIAISSLIYPHLYPQFLWWR